MVQNNPTNVFAAFEMLLEEMEVKIDVINKTIARATDGRDYTNAREAVERAHQANLLREKLVDLRQEWESRIDVHQDKEEEEHISSERRNMGRLQRGLRTPEPAFRIPILKALDEMGGKARLQEVLARVERLMQGLLKDVDYEILPSSPDSPRWRNTAQWERNTMVKQGLLKSNSPRGVWEISDEGRRLLIRSKS